MLASWMSVDGLSMSDPDVWVLLQRDLVVQNPKVTFLSWFLDPFWSFRKEAAEVAQPPARIGFPRMLAPLGHWSPLSILKAELALREVLYWCKEEERLGYSRLCGYAGELGSAIRFMDRKGRRAFVEWSPDDVRGYCHQIREDGYSNEKLMLLNYAFQRLHQFYSKGLVVDGFTFDPTFGCSPARVYGPPGDHLAVGTVKTPPFKREVLLQLYRAAFEFASEVGGEALRAARAGTLEFECQAGVVRAAARRFGVDLQSPAQCIHLLVGAAIVLALPTLGARIGEIGLLETEYGPRSLGNVAYTFMRGKQGKRRAAPREREWQLAGATIMGLATVAELYKALGIEARRVLLRIIEWVPGTPPSVQEPSADWLTRRFKIFAREVAKVNDAMELRTRQGRVTFIEALIQYPGGVIAANRAVMHGRLETTIHYANTHESRLCVAGLMQDLVYYPVKGGRDDQYA